MILQTLIVILTVIRVKTQIEPTIIGFDCFKTKSHFAAINAYEVEECEEIKNDNVKTRNISVQIIQKKTYDLTRIFHCKITMHNIISHCGHNSHASLVKGGFSFEILDISRDDCFQIHSTGIFKYHNNKIIDIKPNSSINRDLITQGYVDDLGNCKGVSFSTEKGNYVSSIILTTITISVSDYLTPYDINRNEITLSDASTCQISRNFCWHDHRGKTFWRHEINNNCDQNQRSADIIYEGRAILSGSDKATFGSIISVNQANNLFALKITSTEHICYQKVLATDHNKIFVIIENPSFGFYFKKNNKNIIPQNVDLTLYMNSKIQFITHSLTQAIKSLHKQIIIGDCQNDRKIILEKLARARMNTIAYGNMLTGEPGYLNILSGEIFYSYKCTPVQVQLRRIHKCYKHLPVRHNNVSYFLEPTSRILTKLGYEIPCSEITPPKFKIGNRWINFNPYPTPSNIPVKLSPYSANITIQYNEIESILSAGLYSPSVMNDYKDFLAFPVNKIQANEFLTSNIILSNTNYNDDMNINNILLTSDITQLSNRIYNNIKSNLLIFGAYSGAILGILSIFQLIASISSTAVNFKILHKTYGWGNHLFASFFNSLTNFLFMQRETVKTEDQDKTKDELTLQPSVRELYPDINQ